MLRLTLSSRPHLNIYPPPAVSPDWLAFLIIASSNRLTPDSARPPDAAFLLDSTSDPQSQLGADVRLFSASRGNAAANRSASITPARSNSTYRAATSTGASVAAENLSHPNVVAAAILMMIAAENRFFITPDSLRGRVRFDPRTAPAFSYSPLTHR